MAYLLHDPHFLVFGIASSEANARSIHGNYDHFKNSGCVKTISDDDFNSLNLVTKTAKVTEAGVVYRDNELTIDSKEHLDKILEGIKDVVNLTIKHKNFTNNPTFKSNLEAYKVVLDSLDTSTISFPIKSLEKYISDNNLGTPINTLQM